MSDIPVSIGQEFSPHKSTIIEDVNAKVFVSPTDYVFTAISTNLAVKIATRKPWQLVAMATSARCLRPTTSVANALYWCHNKSYEDIGKSNRNISQNNIREKNRKRKRTFDEFDAISKYF